MPNLYEIAQQITDEVLGKGTYVRVNKFDPSKGETYAAGSPKPKPKRKLRKARRRT